MAALVRFLWLDRVPGAISGDELSYIIPIKAVALSGHNLGSSWSIFRSLLFSYPTSFPQAELPYFLLYPGVAFFPLTLITTRAIYALISAATAFAMYLLVEKLLGKRAAIFAGFLTAISPWQIFVGRTTLEVVPATFFYLLAIYFLVKEKGSRILISLPLFILAFYSYIGTKIIFLPIVILTSAFAYFLNKKENGKQYLILNAACILFVIFFAVLTLSNPANRGNEIFTPRDPEVTRLVDETRKHSVTVSPVTNLLVNKSTMYLKIVAVKTLGSFSTDLFFVSGDVFTGLYGHGLLYWADGLFLILGAGFMLAKKHKAFILVSGLILVSTLPHVFHTAKTEIFSPHLAFFLTLLIIPVAYGASEITQALKRKVLLCAVVLVYILSFANFLNVYFLQYPLIGHFDFPTRVAARYVALAAGSGKRVDVYVSSAEDFYKKYIYYSNSLNSRNFSEIENSVTTHHYKLGNITFRPCGSALKDFDPKAISIYETAICSPFDSKVTYSRITQALDSGEVYRLYNDSVCSRFNLKPYISDLKLSDFSIEKVAASRFCEAFITR